MYACACVWCGQNIFVRVDDEFNNKKFITSMNLDYELYRKNWIFHFHLIRLFLFAFHNRHITTRLVSFIQVVPMTSSECNDTHCQIINGHRKKMHDHELHNLKHFSLT